jgi:hypothetical protein
MSNSRTVAKCVVTNALLLEGERLALTWAEIAQQIAHGGSPESLCTFYEQSALTGR